MNWNTTHRFTFTVSWCLVGARCPVKIGRFVHRRCFHTGCGAPGCVSWSRWMFSHGFGRLCFCWLKMLKLQFVKHFCRFNGSRFENQQPCKFWILCTRDSWGYICLRLPSADICFVAPDLCVFSLSLLCSCPDLKLPRMGEKRPLPSWNFSW